MKGDPAILQALNACLKQQLTAINQFFLHARMAANWGLERFNEQEYQRSIEAMKQADRLIERILFLEGLPNLQDLGKLLLGEDVPEILGGDLALQTEIRTVLQETVARCEAAEDFLSREILEEILEETEEHIDWIESQQWLIANTGLANYLQSQTGDDS